MALVNDAWATASRRLSACLMRPEEDCGLAETALAVASGEHPRLDVDHYLGILEAFAREVSARRRPDATPSARALVDIAALNEILFHEHGFAGDREEYFNPENCLLHRVMERRRGMPITLAIVYVEVARRAGIPLEGVAFPGHFLVKHTGVVPALIIDVFAGGAILSDDDCQALLGSLHGPDARFHRSLLTNASRLGIVMRVLRNLKTAYVREEDFRRALGVSQCLIDLEPVNAFEWRDRALVRLRLDDTHGALADFERFLDLAEPDADTEEVEEAVVSLRRLHAKMN